MSVALRTALVSGLFAGVAFTPTCEAASFDVTRFDDPVPDACVPGDCSLREAVLAANALPGADTVRLSPGRYFLEQRGIDENQGLTGDIDVTDDLTIIGAGRDATAIDSRSVDYVFEVASAVSLTVRQLGIVNVSLDLPVEQQAGGGIRAGYFGDGNPWTTRLVLEDFLLDASTDLFESIHMRGRPVEHARDVPQCDQTDADDARPSHTSHGTVHDDPRFGIPQQLPAPVRRRS